MPSPRRILLLLASMVGAALVGWVAAAAMAPETRARGTRQAEDLQVELLMQQLQNQEVLSEAERGLLLERLVTLERLQEAEVVLQPWLSGRSTPRGLTLFKAELQRRNGQRAFGICHQCAHFQHGGDARCGLTGEPLVEEQSRRICREWTDPAVVAA